MANSYEYNGKKVTFNLTNSRCKEWAKMSGMSIAALSDIRNMPINDIVDGMFCAAGGEKVFLTADNFVDNFLPRGLFYEPAITAFAMELGEFLDDGSEPTEGPAIQDPPSPSDHGG